MKDLLKVQYPLVVTWIILSLVGVIVGIFAKRWTLEERVWCVVFASVPFIAGMLGTYVQSRFDRDEYVDLSESDIDESEEEPEKPKEAKKEGAKI